MAEDIRKIDKFALTVKKGKFILHSPRGTHMVIKPDELNEVIKLLRNAEE